MTRSHRRQTASQRGPGTALDPEAVRDVAKSFVAEDVGRGDVTTRAVVPRGLHGEAWIETHEPAVVAGLDVAGACFELLAGGPVAWSPDVHDGWGVEAGQRLVVVQAEVCVILGAERAGLNVMAHLSGIATLTARFVHAVADTPVRILDTRKTAPGLRLLEKYAVRVGGGSNHRFGLDDGILIKDNHIVAAGGIAEAVAAARRAAPVGLLIEVEVDGVAQLDEAVAAGADAVLLDNLPPELVAQAVERAAGKVVLEASGGITLDNVRAYAETGVDRISVGALTHSAQSVDLSLEVKRTWEQ